MKPTDQTRFGEGGNCLAACIASLLEVPLDVVPDTGGKGWQEPLGLFLQRYGLYYLETPAGPIIRQATDDPPFEEQNLGWQPLVYVPRSRTPLVIVIGPSPRGAWNHCIVGETNGYGYRMLHDPHPDRSGVRGMAAIGWFAVDARLYAGRGDRLDPTLPSPHPLPEHIPAGRNVPLHVVRLEP